jgi:hypothetical protein
MSKTKLPAIPAPTDANLRDVARAIKGVLDVREGNLGDPLDANVTFRDLVDGGLVEVQVVNRGTGSGVAGVTPALGLGSSSGYDPTTDLLPPPQPTDLQAAGSFASVLLSWSIPSYSNHAFTEIWRADTNVLGSAVMVGTTTGSLYTDYLGNSTTRYYWVRLRSQANVVGAYNAVEGRVGQTAANPELLLESLAGEITEDELFQDLGARIDLIDNPTTGLVTKVESVNGKYTVKVDNAGHVSGFGLASTANDADPFSEFGIRADKFWVAPPAVSSDTEPTTGLFKGYVWLDTSVSPATTKYWTGSAWTTTPQALPFVVKTSGSNPGVYLPAAFIEDATITSAKIADLAADKITAGYTSSVDLESSTFAGSEFYIGGTVTYEYDDPSDGNKKTGIASVANPAIALKGGATPSAEFAVDAFKIKPANDGDASAVFEVVNGVAQIKNAIIGDAAITTAKIDNLAVDTLKIADNAVTIPVFANYASVEVPYSATFQSFAQSTTVATISMSVFGTTPVIVHISVTMWPDVTSSNTQQAWEDFLLFEARQSGQTNQIIYQVANTGNSNTTITIMGYVLNPLLGDLVLKALCTANGNLTTRASSGQGATNYSLPFIKVALLGAKK